MSDYKRFPEGSTKITILGKLWKDIEVNDYGGKVALVNSPYSGGKGDPVSLFYDIYISEKEVERMGKLGVGKGSKLLVTCNVTGYLGNGEKYARHNYKAVDIHVEWVRKDDKQANSPEVVEEVDDGESDDDSGGDSLPF